jgi:hypothetical protein
MKLTFVVSLIALPLALIGLVTKRFGFTVFATLAASVVGVLLAFFSLIAYNQWKVGEVLSGRSAGAVGYAITGDVTTRSAAVLSVCAFGLLLGLLVLVIHWTYTRAQSA